MADEYDSLIPEPSEEDAEAITELEETVSEDDGQIQYKPGLFFDNDLKLDGSGNIMLCEADEAWLGWCKKILATPRYQCDNYSNQIGVDVEEAFSATSRAQVEEILRSEIKGALTADQYHRTAHVNSVNFRWTAPDSVEVEAEIGGFENITSEVTATLNLRG